MNTVLALWLAIDALIWLTILLVAYRTADQRKDFRVGPDDQRCASDLLVSVIIPARDEAPRIGRAVQSVLAQDHVHLELVVLDDGSTDGTGEVVSRFDDDRVRLIDGGGGPLPDGWLGKPWACHRASQQASGEWLLFIDADVHLAPQAVSRSVAYAVEHQLDALSGLGSLDMHTLPEQVMQPIVSGLLMAGNRMDDVNDPSKPDKALANGQFMLFRRQGYERVGGHEAVAANVLDDVGMALVLKGQGVPYHLVYMKRLFRTRMYDGGAELWAGWRKNLFPGLRWSWMNLASLIAGHTLLVLSPYMALLLALAGVVDGSLLAVSAAGVIAIQSVRFYLDGVFGQNRLVGLLTHGPGNFLLVALLIDSAIATSRGAAVWKGRVLPSNN